MAASEVERKLVSGSFDQVDMVGEHAADETAPIQIHVTSVAGKKVEVASGPIQIDGAVGHRPAA